MDAERESVVDELMSLDADVDWELESVIDVVLLKDSDMDCEDVAEMSTVGEML